MQPAASRHAWWLSAALWLISLRAIVQLPLPLAVLILLSGLTCLIGYGLHYRDSRCRQLLHDGQGTWHWNDRGRWQSGCLASGCYRSRLLVVLALADGSGRIHRLCLWRDGLSAREFSYLQLQLLLVERESLVNRG